VAANKVPFTEAECRLLDQGVAEFGNCWKKIVDKYLPHRDRKIARRVYIRMQRNREGGDNTNSVGDGRDENAPPRDLTSRALGLGTDANTTRYRD
jgi:hypothetical protein